MSVSLTAKTKSIPLRPPYIRLIVSEGEATGDASGGRVSIVHDLKKADTDVIEFYLLIDVQGTTDDVTADNDQQVEIPSSSQWRDFVEQTVSSHLAMLDANVVAQSSGLGRDRRVRNLIGQPLKAGTARITHVWKTNTNTSKYYSHVYVLTFGSLEAALAWL